MESTKPIISVMEARKLGAHLDDLTNEELEKLIQDTETLVNIQLEEFLRSKNDTIGASHG